MANITDVDNYPIDSDAAAAADFEQLSVVIIDLNTKWGDRFDKYVPGNDEYFTDDIMSATKFVGKKQSPLQLLEDYILDWYNNYNNAHIKNKTSEQLLEEAYKELEATMKDTDSKAAILNNLQEIMVTLSNMSPRWYHGDR